MRAFGVLVLLLLAGSVAPLEAQRLGPAELYEAGAYTAARDSFARLAREAPLLSEHWYNLAVSQLQVGEEARARAAWVRAARLKPRSNLIRRLDERMGRLDPLSAELLWVSPVTPREFFLIAGVVWLAAWALALVRRMRSAFWAPLAVVALGLAALSEVVRQRYSRNVAVVVQEAPLRQAPYGPAPATRELPPSTAVAVERVEEQWLLVDRGGRRGWLSTAEVETLP